MLLPLIAQATPPSDPHTLFYAWVGANTVVILGIVFKAGEYLNRLETVERGLRKLEEKTYELQDLPARFESLCQRVEEMQEGQAKIADSLDKIKESIFKLSYKP